MFIRGHPGQLGALGTMSRFINQPVINRPTIKQFVYSKPPAWVELVFSFDLVMPRFEISTSPMGIPRSS